MNIQKPSLRKAINAMCKNCTYDRACPGAWRQQTEACNITGCPLWAVRPKSSVSKKEAA